MKIYLNWYQYESLLYPLDIESEIPQRDAYLPESLGTIGRHFGKEERAVPRKDPTERMIGELLEALLLEARLNEK